MSPLKLSAILSCIVFEAGSAFTTVPKCGPHKAFCRPGTQVFSSESEFPWETALDMTDEETLLKLHLTVLDEVDPDMALAVVQRYTQSFPFSAILPVQPLQYLPTHDGGVDVLFLRKKTQDKGSVDGGMRFFVRPPVDGDDGIEVQVKRNSKGQSVSKMFTEKLVVQAYCEGIAGKDEARTGKAPTDFVSVLSVFHKWM
ncbi:hypothetical protein MHU86_23690 [Fragilaria crotonensis]|nr:hypothetical protein MHU86_23690 [Fragilaria crotonensis]